MFDAMPVTQRAHAMQLQAVFLFLFMLPLVVGQCQALDSSLGSSVEDKALVQLRVNLPGTEDFLDPVNEAFPGSNPGNKQRHPC